MVGNQQKRGQDMKLLAAVCRAAARRRGRCGVLGVLREQSWQKLRRVQLLTDIAAIANTETCCSFFSSPSSIAYRGCLAGSNYFLRSSHRYASLNCFLTRFHPKQARLHCAGKKTWLCLTLPAALLELRHLAGGLCLGAIV